jgi:hypothetical protein
MMDSKTAHWCAQNSENDFHFHFHFHFLKQYHKDGDEFLNHIVQVTGDETSNQRAVKVVDTHIFNKQAERFKQMSACQKAYGKSFVEQEGDANGGIHAKRDHNNIRSVSSAKQ